MNREEILDKYYQPGKHWKVVNRKNVLDAMEIYANKEVSISLECIEIGIISELKKKIADSESRSRGLREALEEIVGLINDDFGKPIGALANIESIAIEALNNYNKQV